MKARSTVPATGPRHRGGSRIGWIVLAVFVFLVVLIWLAGQTLFPTSR